ncbi:hypothetical protein CFE70_001465 [Pyrenophora teres f. teres 0-1]
MALINVLDLNLNFSLFLTITIILPLHLPIPLPPHHLAPLSFLSQPRTLPLTPTTTLPNKFSPHSALRPSAFSFLNPIPQTLSLGLASASSLSPVPNNTAFIAALRGSVNLYQFTTRATRCLTRSQWYAEKFGTEEPSFLHSLGSVVERMRVQVGEWEK